MVLPRDALKVYGHTACSLSHNMLRSHNNPTADPFSRLAASHEKSLSDHYQCAVLIGVRCVICKVGALAPKADLSV